ncbi:SUN domain-containing protein 1 isoform X2 [Osmerus mordax]|uniref:SUN domain-containing protein 1 isoform X2 n=1 Tax=Osmerus mordax TaxID=8014 RepID=UPI00350F06DC
MQKESERRMTMDFSRLHTYTPPQCAPENTGYTYSLSSSYSTAALEFEQQHHIAPVFDSPRMSRRSLRLQTTGGLYGNDSLATDFSANHSSVTYSTGGSGRREARTVRSRKQQSLSQTLTETPSRTLSFSTTTTPASGPTASNACLLSSALDQSSLRQHATTTSTSATTEGYWDANKEAILKERRSRAEHVSSKVNGDLHSAASHTHTAHVNGYICNDCSIHSDRKEVLTTHTAAATSSSSSAQAAASSAAALSSSSSSSSTIYSWDKSRRNKTGALASVSGACVRLARRALAPAVSLVTLLFQNLLWLASKAVSPPGKGLMASVCDSARRAVSSSVAGLWLVKQSTLHRMGYRANGYEGKAHSSYCGSMNVKDMVTGDGHLGLNGSLCDDCKGKQHLETHTVVHTHTSRARRLVGALWSLLAYTGYCLLQPGYWMLRAGRVAGSGVAGLAQKLLSVLWMILAAPGKAGRGVLWCVGTGWYQLVSLMSLLNVFILTRCLPKLWKLLLFLLPLLLILALWFWGPSSATLLSLLPAFNLTSPLTYLASLVPASVAVSTPPSPAAVVPLEKSAAASTPQAQPALPSAAVVSGVDLERLERVERRLAVLWEQVQQGDQEQERRHGDALGLYQGLRLQLESRTDRDGLGLWVSGLLEDRLAALRGELEQEGSHRTQSEEQQRERQQSQEARLAELEVLLQQLAVKTQEEQQRQQEEQQRQQEEQQRQQEDQQRQQEQQQRQQEEEELREKERASLASTAPPAPAPAPAPAPISVGVEQKAHDALLAEVQRLEAELGRVRQDLQGVMGCQGKCEQLDTLQGTVSAQVTAQVSAQVKKELLALFYPGGQAQGEVPEALLAWLSERYVRGADLQASLASLELGILRDVALQLEQSRAQALSEAQALTEAQAQAQIHTITQTVTQSVQHSAAGEGLSEEQVQLIVQNALKLYSQDRTGLVDYALESGGGSILSTRCSETYETKTALMSLFGLPLWYFSQSPRVVIQPDVYPGNCWAFKGSQGYLVIRLSLKVLPTAFCLEHIPKALSPTGHISSAPRNFTVYGLDDEYQEEGKLLGQYTYQDDGDSLQTFPVMEKNDKAFQIIEVRVLTNWGHPEYTCLYRVRVHGEPRVQ